MTNTQIPNDPTGTTHGDSVLGVWSFLGYLVIGNWSFPAGGGIVLLASLIAAGCYNTPIDTSDYARGPAPLRMPSPAKEAEGCTSYEDSLTGGQIFTMYCSYCHNAPSLAERPYSQFRNVAAHMRVRANLTGKEYAKLMEWLRRWNDVPPPHPPVEPSPKRFIFSQPIPELREQPPAPELPAPRKGAEEEQVSDETQPKQ